MAVFFFVTAWLLLASSVEVSGLIVNTEVQTNIKVENQNLTESAAEGGAAAGNLSVGNVAVSEGMANESASSPSVTNQTVAGTPSEVSDRPTVKPPNPIGVGAEAASNITTPVTPKEMIPSVNKEQAGTEPQLVANTTTEKSSTTASPQENTGISGANEVIKPAETSAATVVKGQPINEINEGIKTTSVKSVSTSLPTSTTIRPTTTVTVASSASSTSGDKPSTFKNVSSTAETNTNRNTSTSTGSEASTKTTVGTGSDTPKAESSPRTTNTSTSTTTAREPSTSGNSSATTGNISSTTEMPSATNGSQIPETASTTGNAQPTGNATAERNSTTTSGAGPTTAKPINNVVSKNENKSSAVETKTPATGNDTSTLQTIPATSENRPSTVQTIPSSSGNSTIQTIPADTNNATSTVQRLNSTVQTIPTINKNESTIQTIPTTSISQGPRANLTTIIGDPTFVGTNEALDNSTGANGTLSDFSNSTISNATTLVPPLVPTKSELLKRRIEKDTVSIRKNLEKRAAYYKRTETRMTSLLQTIRKRNQLTQTALNHLPELLSALITEPTQRIKLSQLFAAANALQAISSSVGVESASTNNQTTVVSPNEAINATNFTV